MKTLIKILSALAVSAMSLFGVTETAWAIDPHEFSINPATAACIAEDPYDANDLASDGLYLVNVYHKGKQDYRSKSVMVVCGLDRDWENKTLGGIVVWVQAYADKNENIDCTLNSINYNGAVLNTVSNGASGNGGPVYFPLVVADPGDSTEWSNVNITCDIPPHGGLLSFAFKEI